jgi:DNA recombination protein RmuC
MELAYVFGAVIVLLIIYILINNKKSVPTDQSAGLLQQNMIHLTDTVERLKDSLKENIDTKLDRNQGMMGKQLEESAKLIRDVTDRLAKLDETNKRVFDVTEELKTLQSVLSSPKQRGVLGEYFLDSVLKNVMGPGQYQMQYAFADGQIVDAVIFLDKQRILPVDSKFSLENYSRLLDATDPGDKDRLAKAFKADLKLRIDETAKYIRPTEGTLDHAFMFIPSETIYYDLLTNQIGAAGTSSRDLIEYAYVEKKVIIVGPTTLLAYLQTVLHGMRSLQIEEQAKDIQKRVGQLGTHIRGYEEYMQKLGKSLGTTVSHYNTAHKELGKIDKDVIKIAGGDKAVEALLLDRPTSSED